MKRLITCVVLLSLVAFSAVPAWADVKTREKTHVSLGGMLGKMFNLFGGKAAKEGRRPDHRSERQSQGDDERRRPARSSIFRKRKSTTST